MVAVPNAALAYQVLDHIDAHPETWNQTRWWCDTSGCFAGWAVALSGEKVLLDGQVIVDGRYVHVAERAAQLLGFDDDGVLGDACRQALGDWDGHELFAPENTRDYLGRLVAAVFGPRPAPATASEGGVQHEVPCR